MPSVSMMDLAIAFECLDNVACSVVYVSTRTGRVHVIHDDMDEDEEKPEDLETSDEFVTLPNKRDFDLGNALAFRFTEIEMPQEYDKVRDLFHRKGAYGRFKHLLESKNLLQSWHRFEEE